MTSYDFQIYAKQRNLVKSQIRSAQRNYEEQLINKFSTNSKAFYSYVKSKQKIETSIPHLKISDDITTSNNLETVHVEVFNSFFQSTFTHENIEEVPAFSSRTDVPLTDITITDGMVFDKLSKFKPFKSPGLDGIHPYTLKECSISICRPLCMLYNQSLQSGQLPLDWKCANIIPVFKRGVKSEASNYRPISLTSQIIKILESIICDSIHKLIADHNLIHPHQHGFVPRKSCLTNLLESFQDWIHSADEGFGDDIIYLDYKKAFDSVPHQRLLHKIEGYGVSGNLLSWVTNFLDHRYQRVTVDGVHSKWCSVISGVPQGSVLGPLLFIIYINNLSENINCSIKQYADDTKLYTTVKDNNDVLQFQHHLDAVAEWSNVWQLSFNFSKCKHMQVGNKLSVDYNLMDHQNGERKIISHVSSEHDLGIWCTADLKPSLQCQHAVSKAMKVLGLIKRTFKYFNNTSLSKLYKTYVRPHLEYCVQVWSPFLAGDIDSLEKVQHRTTKLVPLIANLPYE